MQSADSSNLFFEHIRQSTWHGNHLIYQRIRRGEQNRTCRRHGEAIPHKKTLKARPDTYLTYPLSPSIFVLLFGCVRLSIRGETRGGTSAPQNSIYYASEETVPESQLCSELIYAKDAYPGGTETSLSILMRIGWSPEITYEQTKYMSMKKENQIFW